MQRKGVLRIFRFHAAAPDSVLDAMLRDELLPGLGTLAGNRFVVIGRRVVGTHSERVVVSAWNDFESMDAAVGHTASANAYRPDISEAAADESLELFDLAAQAQFGRTGEIAVLRAFVGTTAHGRLREFVDEAAGAGVERLAIDERCAFVLVGRREPDAFAVVSGWTDWAGVADTTGGDITGPVTVAHANQALIASGEPIHYEVMQPPPLPSEASAADRPAERATMVANSSITDSPG